MSTKAAHFVSWLLEDVDSVTAEANSPRDEQLKEFARDGFLRLAFTAHGDNTYVIITGGFRAFWDAASVFDPAALSSDKGTESHNG